LRQRLAEQERELSAFHEKEQRHAEQSVREEERQRLTRDLHDGLSGHLVSIIALSECGADPHAVERAARAALDDLRFVINSLDIGDRDLPLAMAGFREKLEPQLRRLGITLDWSMEKLPDISGVTPGNALSILRILQEAVTNALKHGSSLGIISIRGIPAAAGAAITIGNSSGPGDQVGSGRGLNNMLRRAQALGGGIDFERSADRAILTLNLPLRLAER
jgi:signal transduction histidine kinase